MDIVAHGLWAGIGLAAAGRRWPISRRTAIITIGLAVLPDIAHLLPILGSAASQPNGLSSLWKYVTARPGLGPDLPATVNLLAHHLHCIFHSAVVAAVVSAAIGLAVRTLWIPLLGWWSHIVIDVFTHSAQFYPSPVLYPFTLQGFDGVAWNTPWFMLGNYAAIVIALIALILTRRRSGLGAPPAFHPGASHKEMK